MTTRNTELEQALSYTPIRMHQGRAMDERHPVQCDLLTMSIISISVLLPTDYDVLDLLVCHILIRPSYLEMVDRVSFIEF